MGEVKRIHGGAKPLKSIVLADDYLYTEQNKTIAAFSKQDGSLLFVSKKRLKGDIKSVAGQGDLLYFICENELLAIDRYTGEQVWQADEGMTAAYHVMTSDNRVYFSNTLGEIRCYEWSEPYHSPAKP